MVRLFRQRLMRVVVSVITGIAAIGVISAVGPSAAYAGSPNSCGDELFCWYNSTNYDGTIGVQYYYTSGFITMPSLVDQSESSVERQLGDTNCFHTDGFYNYWRPWVYLRDTYYSTTWTSLRGMYYDHRTPTFNGIQTDKGVLDMRNKFNLIWNWC